VELPSANGCTPVGVVNDTALSQRLVDSMHSTVILPSPERLPLPPRETASMVCLLHRLHPIHDLLLKRGFSDAVASRAVDVALMVGRDALSSGKAARMSGEWRAGWLWKVALNAARRAAATEPSFVSLKYEPLDRHSESRDDQALLEALRREIDKLAPKQKQAIELHGLQGLSFREAARLIGVRPATVAYRYNAGFTRLVSAMKAVTQSGHGKKSLNARAC
jgi:Sigma-70, region 4